MLETDRNFLSFLALVYVVTVSYFTIQIILYFLYNIYGIRFHCVFMKYHHTESATVMFVKCPESVIFKMLLRYRLKHDYDRLLEIYPFVIFFPAFKLRLWHACRKRTREYNALLNPYEIVKLLHIVLPIHSLFCWINFV